MANKKISELELLNELSGNEYIPIISEGKNYKIKADTIKGEEKDDCVFELTTDGGIRPKGSALKVREKSFAENIDCSCLYQNSHAEGQYTFTTGPYAHAEGMKTTATYCGHAEGYCTSAGQYAHAEGFQTTASGNYAHTEGANTSAGQYSHAEGSDTVAENYSHAEGYQTTAINYSHAEGKDTSAINYSHAEGGYTFVNADYGHAEGRNTSVLGAGGHAEGIFTQVHGQASHAEGYQTCVTAIQGHAEGYNTSVGADYGHAEGYQTLIIIGAYGSHAEGYQSQTLSSYAHAEGYNTSAGGTGAHTEGGYTKTQSNYEHASGYYNISLTPEEGEDKSQTTLFTVGNGEDDDNRHNALQIMQDGTIYIPDIYDVSTDECYEKPMLKLQDFAAFKLYRSSDTSVGIISVKNTRPQINMGNGAISIGSGTMATGEFSFAGGAGTTASGVNSFAWGNGATASNNYSVIFGAGQSEGTFSFAAGGGVRATGNYSFASGSSTYADGNNSHAEGNSTHSKGQFSHAEGYNTTASGEASHTEGYYTNAQNNYEHASGQYNNSIKDSSDFGSSENTLFTVGNGKDKDNHHNALQIMQNGEIYIVDTAAEGEYYEKPMIKLQDALTSGDYVTPDQLSTATVEAATKLICKPTTVTNINKVPVSSPMCFVNTSASGTFGLDGEMAAGTELQVIIDNVGSDSIVITIPDTFKSNGVSEIAISPDTYGEINVISSGTKLYLRAIGGTDLQTNKIDSLQGPLT